jgi:hypothetical protein
VTAIGIWREIARGTATADGTPRAWASPVILVAAPFSRGRAAHAKARPLSAAAVSGRIGRTPAERGAADGSSARRAVAVAPRRRAPAGR